ncbi:putative CDC123-like protein [Lausannevirus]|uniref:Putative CDC123-like protein n=1 Tax=Lausannevirus TaxID=999883 RepID=F2WLY2_9VIRU|nr:putative CDC123-like protein [Lausannevirus]AEA07255.1 putative CDC123-like protein [Lausannevirus]
MQGYNQPCQKSLFWKHEDGTVSFPKRYKEYLENIEIIREVSGRCYTFESLETLREKKISFTHAENWYPHAEEGRDGERFLTFESVLLPFSNFEKVDDAIQKLGGSVFVRLSSLSPKFFEPVQTKEEVLSVLTESERTRDNLENSVLFLRKYFDFPKNKEFRLFVRKGKLRAISKYDPEADCGLPKEGVQQKVSKWFRCLCLEGLLSFEDCTLDIVLWEERRELSLFDDGIFLIEYNSYGEDSISGSCLFDWEKDWEILTKGKAVTRC